MWLVLSRRRSKLEIYLDVMWAIKEGTFKPTQIMYQANLSYKPLRKILASMVAQEVIENGSLIRGDKRTKETYRLTQKGENIISYFRKARELLPLKEMAMIR